MSEFWCPQHRTQRFDGPGRCPVAYSFERRERCDKELVPVPSQPIFHAVCAPGARIIIDKSALDAGDPAIQFVRETPYGTVRSNHREIRIDCGDIIIRQHATPQQDGTRIEIVGFDVIEVTA